MDKDLAHCKFTMAVQQVHLRRIGNEHPRLATLMRARGRATSVVGPALCRRPANTEAESLAKRWVKGLFLKQKHAWENPRQ
jgi:hypothetical protein